MLQRALNAENKRLIKKATASVPSPVTNIRSYLAEKGAEAPDDNAFLDKFAATLLQYYGEREVMPFPIDVTEEIEQLRREKYSQRSWNYRL
jgi:lipoate-protein ligase A